MSRHNVVEGESVLAVEYLILLVAMGNVNDEIKCFRTVCVCVRTHKNPSAAAKSCHEVCDFLSQMTLHCRLFRKV